MDRRRRWLSWVVMVAAGATVGAAQLDRDGVRDSLTRLAAERAGAPVRLVHVAARSYPLVGATVYRAKGLDGAGNVVDVAIDQEGNPVDARALQDMERAYLLTHFGRIAPELFHHMARLGDEDRVDVALWLQGAEAAPQLLRPTREEVAARGRTAFAERRQAWEDEHAAWMAAWAAPVVDAIRAGGAWPTYQSPLAPAIYATLPVRLVRELARHPRVQRIDRAVTYAPELASAVPSSTADWPRGKGYDGTGIEVGVVECGRIDFGNSLVPGCSGTNTRDAAAEIGCHATCVAGIVASSDGTDRGVAPGACLYSANATDWTDANLSAASSWASSRTAIHNHSYGGDTNGVLGTHDRELDYLARNASDTITKSAGNRACASGGGDGDITSPGLGWNVITTGNYTDGGSAGWGNDSMNSCSSWVDPVSANGDREEPDVTAPGSSITSTAADQPTEDCGAANPFLCSRPPNTMSCGSGTSYSAPLVAGAVAQLMELDASLEPWPEGIRAILMATALHNIEGATRLSELDGAGAIVPSAAFRLVDRGQFSLLNTSAATFPITQTFTAYAGQRVRVAIAWDSTPSADPYATDILKADLDLSVTAPNASQVGSSASYDNSYELVEFTAPSTGTYTIHVTEFRFDGTAEPLGIAWWSGVPVLAPYAQLLRTMPPDSEDELLATPGAGWSATAIRPNGNDADLYLYNGSRFDDPADYAQMASSANGTGAVDYVLLDGNHSGSNPRFPTAKRYTGSGNYWVEHAPTTQVLTSGSYGPYTFGITDVARVWDLDMLANQAKAVAVHVDAGDADVGMALHQSYTSPGVYQGMGGAEVLADAGAAGAREELQYTHAINDLTGLVVWNKGATTTTTFHLYVDATPPTGTVSINAGAACATSSSVTLTLSATDGETAPYQMSFWNPLFLIWGPWESYATSRSFTLASGEGTRWVSVRFKNYAGLVSASVSDSIVVDLNTPGQVTNLGSNDHLLGSCSSDMSVTMLWSPASDGSGCGVVGYGVLWSQGAPAMPPAVQDIGDVVIYTETLPAGASYYFNIRAVDGAGKWSASSTSWGPFSLDDAPQLVTPLQAGKLGATDLRVSWPPSPGADLYRVERADDPAFTIGVVQVGGDTPALFVDDPNALLSPRDQYYRVKALNACGEVGP